MRSVTGVIALALFVGVGAFVLSHRADGRARPRRRAGARVSSRSALAEAAAESLDSGIGHRPGRRRARSHLDRAPRDRFADRAHGSRHGHEPADGRRLLRAGAAGPRVRRGGRARQSLGRAGSGIRVARVAGRHRRRCQRQRLDRGGRSARDDIPEAARAAALAARQAAAAGGGGGAVAGGRGRRCRSRRRGGAAARRRTRRRGRGARLGGGGREAQPQRGGRGNAAPPRPADAHVLKFSRTGQFLLQIGKAGEPGAKDSQTGLDHPADVAVDSAANEVYVADGGDEPAHRRLRREHRRVQAAVDGTRRPRSDT